MAALNFPNSPTGQTPANTFSPTSTPEASTNGVTYIYNATNGAWTAAPSSAVSDLQSVTEIGNTTTLGATFGGGDIDLNADGSITAAGEVKVEGASTPTGLWSGISKYGSLLIGTTSEVLGNAKASIDSGTGASSFAGNMALDFAAGTTGEVFRVKSGSDRNILFNGDGSATFSNSFTFNRETAPTSIRMGGSDTYAVWLNDSNFVLKYDGSATFAGSITAASHVEVGNIQRNSPNGVGVGAYIFPDSNSAVLQINNHETSLGASCLQIRSNTGGAGGSNLVTNFGNDGSIIAAGKVNVSGDIELEGFTSETSSLSRETSGSDTELKIQANGNDGKHGLKIYSTSAYDGKYSVDARRSTGVVSASVLRSIASGSGYSGFSTGIESIVTEDALEANSEYSLFNGSFFVSNNASNVTLAGYRSNIISALAPNGKAYSNYHDGDAPSFFRGLTEHAGGVNVTGGELNVNKKVAAQKFQAQDTLSAANTDDFLFIVKGDYTFNSGGVYPYRLLPNKINKATSASTQLIEGYTSHFQQLEEVNSADRIRCFSANGVTNSLQSGPNLNQVIGYFSNVTATKPTNAGGASYGAYSFYAEGSAPSFFEGNVGIGTDEPQRSLHVQTSSSSGQIKLGRDYHGYIQQETNTFKIIANGDQDYRVGLGTNNGFGDIAFQTANATTGNTTRMAIDKNGLVGIGTDTPKALVHIKNNNAGGMGANIELENNSGSANTKVGIYFSPNSAAPRERAASIESWNIGTTRADLRMFVANGGTPKEAMRIDAAGSVFFANGSSNITSDPVGSRAAGNLSFGPNSNSQAINYYSVGDNVMKLGKQSSGNLISFYVDNPAGGALGVGGINTNGSVIALFGTSDYRVKKNVQPLSGASAVIQALNPVTYEFTDRGEDGERQQGFIAHELQECIPEAVFGEKDAEEAIGTLADYDGSELETAVTEPDDLTYTEELEATPYVAAVAATYDEDGEEVTVEVPAVEATFTTVTRTKTWTSTGTRPVYQGVDQAKLIPLLTKALQEALDRIEALENA